MKRKSDLPDTYIDPWTGEEKRVESWDDDNSPPLNSVIRSFHGDVENYSTEDFPACQSEFTEAQKWLAKKRIQKMVWFYVAFGMLFLILNFWIFRGF